MFDHFAAVARSLGSAHRLEQLELLAHTERGMPGRFAIGEVDKNDFQGKKGLAFGLNRRGCLWFCAHALAASLAARLCVRRRWGSG
jgi:hypothetical protein